MTSYWLSIALINSLELAIFADGFCKVNKSSNMSRAAEHEKRKLLALYWFIGEHLF